MAQGRDFTAAGELKSADVLHLDAAAAAALAERLDNAAFAVSSVERKPYRRSPYAPFRTTTLQQDASRQLGFSAKHTMSIAQRLYENGYITYMRTDSVTLSQTAISAARKQAASCTARTTCRMPRAPTPARSRTRRRRTRPSARPETASAPRPRSPRTDLSSDELRLYELIWKRTVASQMKDATGESVSVRVAGTSTGNERAEFGATGKVINFYGFLKLYVEGADDPTADRDDRERRLPPLAESDPLDVLRLAPAEHSTRPPARYTEASLVKELEDREIGRPSTYATIIGTILDRGYVFKKGTALVPSFLAFAVVTLLEQHFGQLVDYEFTARMEDVLDEIARGEAERVPWLRRFYFGDGDASEANHSPGLKALVSDIGDIDAREVSSFPLAGTDIVVRVGRYGPYLERDGQRVNVPEDIAPDELTVGQGRGAVQPAERGRPPRHRPGQRPRGGRQGGPVRPLRDRAAARASRPSWPRLGQAADRLAAEVHGPGHRDAGRRAASCSPCRGRSASWTASRSPCRTAGTARTSRRARDSRSLESEEQLFSLSLAEAKELFAQPKARGRRTGAATPPLRELGEDPATGKPMVIKDGRFGPYVTDGETNASLRKGDEVASITVQRAAELLADRARRPAAGDPPEEHNYQEEGRHPGPFGGQNDREFPFRITIGD